MKTRTAATVAILLSGLGACSPPAGQNADGVDRHLRCAALISAADKLAYSGVLELDRERRAEGGVELMVHLNAYAIPSDISEGEAVAAVEAERERLIGTMEPAQVEAGAQSCIREAAL
jgi:hypothetical protein